ncbi:Uncharacterised protein [Klebsiella pneumoniae]|uniref:Uncharacterized protein n=1 Tax=Klebsiella pneumoniae TaxID=573 RepID=A0A2X3F0R2_KLEPN|nr:Uncharacterised protein [Klebsiella pneumoniae]
MIAVGMRGGELGEQRLQYLASVRRRVRPVQQHPSQTGDDAGHSELLMQEVVQQRILPTETVVAPEGLDTQQVHGQDLANHALMGGANGIRRLRHPQQAGVLQQPACMVFRAVSRLLPSEVLGRIIIISPPQRIPTMTSQTRDWAMTHSS